MKKFKVGVCGNFDIEHTPANGQTIKTINVCSELENIFGRERVCRLDTFGFKRNPLKSAAEFMRLLKNCENVVLLPSAGAVKILVPIGAAVKKRYSCRLYYLVVGAWLGKMLRKRKILLGSMKKLDGIFSETETLKKELQSLGLENVDILVNFKSMPKLSESELTTEVQKPLKLCFLARVTEMKGVGELIETIREINKEETKYTLDIYGPVEDGYKETFGGINLPEGVKYCGVADGNKTVDILKDYFMQVFPTKYATEGIPGSIIDSYYAGVPVLASRWNSCYDIVDEGITGITFELGNFTELRTKLEYILQHPGGISAMKVNCLKKADDYDPKNALRVLVEKMEVKV